LNVERGVLVKEVMSRSLVALEPESRVLDAAKLMFKYNVGCVLVVERGRLAGIFTERDLVVAVALAGGEGLRCRLRDVMTRSVATVRPSDPVSKAVCIMARLQVRHVPVVDEDGRPVGVVSARDVIALMARGKIGGVRCRLPPPRPEAPLTYPAPSSRAPPCRRPGP
jgi:CBS domain-containing protein